MNDNLKHLSAMTALNHMMAGGHFSISTIDRVADLLGIDPQRSEAYKVLRPLHCIDWGRIPAELRDAVPGLIQDCLGIAPAYRFKTTQQEVIDVAPSETKPERGGFLRLIGMK